MFVDWVSVSQRHGEGNAPDFAGSLTFAVDEHGEPGYETAGARTVRGSFDTSMRIRSHNGRVSVSGNPSRWGRPDNLFGFDLDGCMAVINRELVARGLPEFTRGVAVEWPQSIEPPEHGLPDWTGATFSMIHCTRNLRAGSPLRAKLAIKSYQGKAAAYLRKHVYGDETAIFLNSRRGVKAYRKGPEMAAHAPHSTWTDWADAEGIVRHEVEFKSRYLHDTGMRYWGNATMGRLHHFFRKETAILGNPEVSFEPLDLEQLRPFLRTTYIAWRSGEDVRALMSRSQFYVHRAGLRRFGIDIAEVRNLATVEPIVRVIDLVEAEAPAGYWQEAA